MQCILPFRVNCSKLVLLDGCVCEIVNITTIITEETPMCGIVGFTGHVQAAPVLLDGLEKLEYRGYDSAGLAVQNQIGK